MVTGMEETEVLPAEVKVVQEVDVMTETGVGVSEAEVVAGAVTEPYPPRPEVVVQ